MNTGLHAEHQAFLPWEWERKVLCCSAFYTDCTKPLALRRPRNPLSRYGLKPMHPWGMDKMDDIVALLTPEEVVVSGTAFG